MKRMTLIVTCMWSLIACTPTPVPKEEVAKSAMMANDPRYDEVSVRPRPPQKGDADLCGSQYKYAARYSNACPKGSQCQVMHEGVVCYGDLTSDPSKNMVRGNDY